MCMAPKVNIGAKSTPHIFQPHPFMKAREKVHFSSESQFSEFLKNNNKVRNNKWRLINTDTLQQKIIEWGNRTG